MKEKSMKAVGFVEVLVLDGSVAPAVTAGGDDGTMMAIAGDEKMTAVTLGWRMLPSQGSDCRSQKVVEEEEEKEEELG
ncbi:hypothetical protein VTH82DRAFT_6832 [Thermothelomyces myriococcoides]